MLEHVVEQCLVALCADAVLLVQTLMGSYAYGTRHRKSISLKMNSSRLVDQSKTLHGPVTARRLWWLVKVERSKCSGVTVGVWQVTECIALSCALLCCGGAQRRMIC